ncbi:calcium uniporter protein, mitochondrial-like [Asterias rubens]|uniref:calcium uniporter protein, mitochondrial-like n=1 Tax=Asterias rubens TaxID=7604 RepID=UPI00145523A6|nr:calcium uniporter protein, mitochondrial-like [Asterias rubens]
MAFRSIFRLDRCKQQAFFAFSALSKAGKRDAHRFLPGSLRLCAAAYCSAPSDNGVQCEYQNGLPVLLVPLPSRRERCQFTLKPVTETVGDFINHVKAEDGGVDRAGIYNEEGVKIAKSTSIDVLMRNPFTLTINDDSFRVDPPELVKLISEDARTMADVKSMIYQLYSTLHVEQHQLEKEKDLRGQLENLKVEIEPMEKLRLDLEVKAARNANMWVWGGLGYMGLQFGLLARLTWWEYSWDIVEPITYFVTYGGMIFMYGYFVLTRQEYTNPDAKDRQHLLSFHRFAKKQKLDIEKYNQLRDQITQLEMDLGRLRDPLTLHLPITPPPAEKIEE